jgi:hypothetical protein
MWLYSVINGRRDHALFAGLDDAGVVPGAKVLGGDDADDGYHAHADQEQDPEPVACEADGRQFVTAKPADDDHVCDDHSHLGDEGRRQWQADPQNRPGFLPAAWK